MEKFNIDNPDWFNIYSDDMVLKTKFEIKSDIFLKSFQHQTLEYCQNVCMKEIVFIKQITKKEIHIVNLNDNYFFKVPNNPAVFAELQENFLKIIEVDGKEIK